MRAAAACPCAPCALQDLCALRGQPRLCWGRGPHGRKCFVGRAPLDSNSANTPAFMVTNLSGVFFLFLGGLWAVSFGTQLAGRVEGVNHMSA